jgi:hypothetical protein
MNSEEILPILIVTDAPDSKAEEVIEEGCESAWGPDADRRCNSLRNLTSVGFF